MATTGTDSMGRGQYLGWFHGRDLHRGITLLGERFRDIELVSANAVFSVLFGIGGLLGPFMAGTAMSAIGPAGFPLSLLAAVVVYAVFALYRQLARA